MTDIKSVPTAMCHHLAAFFLILALLGLCGVFKCNITEDNTRRLICWLLTALDL